MSNKISESKSESESESELMCFTLWFLSNVSTYVSDSIHFVLHPLPVR